LHLDIFYIICVFPAHIQQDRNTKRMKGGCGRHLGTFDGQRRHDFGVGSLYE